MSAEGDERTENHQLAQGGFESSYNNHDCGTAPPVTGLLAHFLPTFLVLFLEV